MKISFSLSSLSIIVGVVLCILKDVPEYGLDEDYCILGIKKLNIKE